MSIFLTKTATALGELGSLLPAWRDLARAAPIPSSPTWALTWWKTFGEGRSLRVLFALDGAKLIGVLAMSERRLVVRAVPRRRLELLGTGEPEADELNGDCVGPVFAKGCEERAGDAFAAELVRYAAAWDELHFAQMDGAARGTVALEEALAAHGLAVRETPRGQCPKASLPPTWEDFVATLSPEGRARVEPAAKRLDDEGSAASGVSPAKVDHDDDVELRSLQNDFARLGDGRFQPGPQNRFRAFHDAALAELASEERLARTRISSDGAAVAVGLAWRTGGGTFVYATATSSLEGLETMLHVAMVRRAIALGQTHFEFQNGVTRERTLLCGGKARRVVNVSAPSPSLRGQLVGRASRATLLLQSLRKNLR